MQEIDDALDLKQQIEQQPGLVVLFGGQHCGVCQVIKPKLAQMLSESYPQLKCVYIDCQMQPEICAQNSIFSLPVVHVYFNGQRFIEKARSFSLPALISEIERPYQLMFG